MAKVTTSFNAANLQTASASIKAGWNVGTAVSWGVNAYDNSANGSIAKVSSLGSNSASGILTNGDTISGSGSSLTSNPVVINRLDYTFTTQKITASLNGSVSVPSSGSRSGYLDKVIVSSDSAGTITILGHDDIAVVGDSTISSVSKSLNGVESTASGSLKSATSVVGGTYQTTLSGAYTSFAVTCAGQSMQLSDINVLASSDFASADAFFASALSGNDAISGSTGNDLLTGYAGNDTLDGSSGIDTAVFSGNRANYTLAKTGSACTVQANTGTGTDGTDTLSNVERLTFSDTRLALDLEGNAGIAAKTLGAVFGAASLASKGYVGIGLNLLDGGMSNADLMLAALNAKLGNGFSNSAEVTLLFQNLAGAAPSAADLAYWTNELATGHYSQASLAIMAADLDLNKTNINLVGLQKTGIEYS